MYTRVKDGLQGRVPSGLQPLIAAAVATLASAGVEAPLALASLRAMVGVRSGVKLSGIYEGFVAALMRDVPKEAVAFATYEGLVGNEGAGGWRRAVCGVVAGGVAGFVTAPMDFAATRVVAEGGKAGPLLRRVLSGGGGDAFRGAPLRISREAVAAALFFVIYDALRLDEGEGEGQ